MIARIWKGWTRREDAERYEELFREVVLPEVTTGVTGYKGMNLLKRNTDGETEFTTIFWFDSMEAVRAFAGDDIDRAVVPDAVRELMIRVQDHVSHHEVVL